MANAGDEKRQALSKAMGAAFLSHQVAQLERSVDSITFSRDARLYDPGRRGGRGRAGGSEGRTHSRAHASEKSEEPRQCRVIDASALVHALPLIKRWVRENTFQLIVPLQAFSTLDILKKAQNPLHDLARDATKFLEQQLHIAQQISASFGGVDADTRIRLRAQAPHEELSWSEVEKLFVIPEGFVVTKSEEPVQNVPDRSLREVEGEEDEGAEDIIPPSANDVPRSSRSALQCALYFQQRCRQQHSAAAAALTLFKKGVRVPTPYEPDLSNEVGSGPEVKAPLDYLAVSSGDALAYWCATFIPTISIYSIPPPLVDTAREWFKSLAREKEQHQKERNGKSDQGRHGPHRQQHGQAVASSRHDADASEDDRGGGGRERGNRGGSGARGGRRGRPDRGGSSKEPSKSLFVP